MTVFTRKLICIWLRDKGDAYRRDNRTGGVKIVSAAFEPEYSRNTKQKIATVGIGSLVIGLFLAFFVEFWEKKKIRRRVELFKFI